MTDRHLSAGDLVAEARRRFAAVPFEVSPREALLLLGKVLGISEAQVLARSSEPVHRAERERFEALLERRLRGEPVAYLFGEKEFYGRLFAVDARVLVPRPETEHLVDLALVQRLPPAPLILDVGSGSGAIAITLALEIPGARVVATDLSPGALEVTRENARRHGVDDKVWPVLADLASPLRLERFDLAVSNPPYVDPAVAPELSPEVREFEPHQALFAPNAGKAILGLLLGAAQTLRPGTRFLIEIGHDQADGLRREIAAASGLDLVEIRPDYAGIPRIAVVEKPRSGEDSAKRL